MLENIRVVDLSRGITGGLCTRILSDLGSEVIKIESKRGDFLHNNPVKVNGISYLHAQMACGKKSLWIDFSKRESIEIIKKLVKVSDVVVENFRPGVLDSIGLGYNYLKEINQKVILCSITGFGQTGSEKNKPAFGPILHAYSGLTYSTSLSPSDLKEPAGFPYNIADTNGSLYAVISILFSIIERDKTGVGKEIDLSLLDCLFSVMDTIIQRFIFTNGKESKVGLGMESPLKTIDGFVCVYSMYKPNEILKITERLDLSDKFSSTEKVVSNLKEFLEIQREWAKSKTIKEVCDIFEKFDIPYSKVNTIADIVNSPLIREREMLVNMHIGDKETQIVNTPFKFSGNTIKPINPPPFKGEHNLEVLSGILKFSKEEIENFIERKVVLRSI